MICNKCQQELPEDSRFCPFCGETIEIPLAEEEIQPEEIPEVTEPSCEPEEITPAEAEETVSEPEEEISEEIIDGEDAPEDWEADEEAPQKKKPKIWLMILAGIFGLALLAVLVCYVLYTQGVNLKFWENDISCKESFSVEDDQAEKKADQVVATIGDVRLTNGELQIYYWETVYSFLNNNYYYLSYYGLDTETPFDEQPYIGDESITWEQYFLQNALETWQRYTTLQLMSQEAQFVLDTDTQELLDNLPTTLLETATSAGYDSVATWLTENCGPGSSEAGYTNYIHAYYEGLSYLYSRYDDLEPTDEEITAYFTENETTFTENGVTKDGGSYYDVRHILLEVEGGTEAEDGTVTYSDAEWEACREKAQALLDQYLAGEATEDSFAELANANSADTGSNTNGGLYTQLTADTSFVQEFKDWYLDESREVGDTGLVMSSYGYHVMYFSGSQEIWYYTAAQQLLSERISDMIDAGMEQHPMEINYRKIILGTKESL